MPASFAVRRFAVATACLTLLLVSEMGASTHFKALHRFLDGTDGAFPNTVILDSTGNLYGTAQQGGDLSCVAYEYYGCGVVFEITRSSKGKWHELVLYAFHGLADGGMPVGNLLFDASGNLYGTTSFGGTGNCQLGCGTVFELSPSQNGWTETVLYNFQNGADGKSPSGLQFDASGNLFGVSAVSYYGSVILFELSPPQQKGGTWTETTLYNQDFQLSPNLVFDKKGRLYDTSPITAYQGSGVVFDLEQVGQGWQETNLFDFKGGGNGGDPQSGVILDDRGRMYGTASAGGNKWGIAFELKRSGNHWKQVMLHNFCSLNNCADGASPDAPLTFDKRGSLYGMTSGGGKGCGCGVVFKLSPTKSGRWEETVLYNFQDGPFGQGSANGLTLDDKGHIYGATAGSDSFGTVFELTP